MAYLVGALVTLVTIALFSIPYRKLRSFLQARFEGPVFEPAFGGLAVPSDHVATMARVFRRRRTFWMLTAAVEGVCIAILIAGGIVVFLWPEYITEGMASRQETELRRTIDSLKKDIQSRSEALFTAKKQKARLERLTAVCQPVAAAASYTEKFAAADPNVKPSFLTQPLELALQIISALADRRAPLTFTWNSTTYGPYDSNELAEFAVRIQDDFQIDLSLLKNDLEKAQTEVTKAVAQPEYADDARQSLAPLAARWSQIQQSVARMIKERDQLGADVQQQDAKATELEILTSQQSLQEKQEQLADAERARDYQLRMLWIPNLTLRIGTVILLLFLTQIVVAVFRYHVALAGFYGARADALQLAGRGMEDNTVNTDHFKMLIEKLSPEILTIDNPPSPLSQIADIIKNTR